MQPPDIIFLDLNMPRERRKKTAVNVAELHKDKHTMRGGDPLFNVHEARQEMEDAWVLEQQHV